MSYNYIIHLVIVVIQDVIITNLHTYTFAHARPQAHLCQKLRHYLSTLLYHYVLLVVYIKIKSNNCFSSSFSLYKRFGLMILIIVKLWRHSPAPGESAPPHFHFSSSTSCFTTMSRDTKF